MYSEPDVEPVRVTLCLPKGADGAPIDDAPVVIWDHGTGGHAYNAIARTNAEDRSSEVAAALGFACTRCTGRHHKAKTQQLDVSVTRTTFKTGHIGAQRTWRAAMRPIVACSLSSPSREFRNAQHHPSNNMSSCG